MNMPADSPATSQPEVPVEGQADEARAAQQRESASRAIIMMVDDEPTILESLQMFLEEAGYQRFVTTTEPRKAKSLLEERKPDVLLLDVMMPDINGLELLAWMRSQEGLKHIPVVILTSATDSETKLKALELGASDFLGKPVDPSELALRLRNTLAAKAYQDRLVNYDELTGLPNRRKFKDQLAHALATAKLDSSACAVLHIGLDRFKQINDTLGDGAGDVLLKRIADRLEQCVRGSDVISRPNAEHGEYPLCRTGGDEFTLLLTKIRRLEDATMVARRILTTLAKPFLLAKRELFVTASIGIAVYPMDGDNAEAMLKHADVAMFHAKRRGTSNYQYYSTKLNARSVERLSLESHLRKALQQRELFLQFQPKVEVKTGTVTGAEALLRWKHPEYGVLPPMKFIPLAEETNLIVPFGEWVLNAACTVNKHWQVSGLPPMRVFVNVSSRQFDNGEKLKLAVRNALERSELEGKYLGLELTEGAVMENPEENAKLLQEIKEMGVKVSIDDFGTGYSSLSYLRRFPLDELKIDRSFLREIPDNDDAAALVSAIIAMAHRLGLTVVAEGVETDAQLAFLQDQDCDEFQGYLKSKPVLASDFAALFLQDQAKAS